MISISYHITVEELLKIPPHEELPPKKISPEDILKIEALRDRTHKLIQLFEFTRDQRAQLQLKDPEMKSEDILEPIRLDFRDVSRELVNAVYEVIDLRHVKRLPYRLHRILDGSSLQTESGTCFFYYSGNQQLPHFIEIILSDSGNKVKAYRRVDSAYEGYADEEVDFPVTIPIDKSFTNLLAVIGQNPRVIFGT